MWGFFMQSTKSNVRLNDKLLIFFFGGILAGSIIVNIIPFSWVLSMNVWSADYIGAFVSKSVKFSTMCRYLLRMRGIIMAGLFLIMLTPFIKKLLYLLPAYVGLAWGMVSSIIMMEHGVNGIRICFFLLFPHFIFYGAGLAMMIFKILTMKNTSKRKVDFTLLFVFLLSSVWLLSNVFL